MGAGFSMMTFEEAKTHLSMEEVTSITHAFKRLTHFTMSNDSEHVVAEPPTASSKLERCGDAFADRCAEYYSIDARIGRALYAMVAGSVTATLEFKDFLCAVCTACLADPEKRRQFWFKVFDVSKNECVTPDEFHSMLCAVARSGISAGLDVFGIGRTLDAVVSEAVCPSSAKEVEQMNREEQEQWIHVSAGAVADHALQVTHRVFGGSPQLKQPQFCAWLRGSELDHFMPVVLRPLMGYSMEAAAISMKETARPLQLLGYSSSIMSPVDLCILRCWTRSMLDAANMALLFSTSRDGYSATSLLSYVNGERLQAMEPGLQLLVARDTSGAVFGALLASQWRRNADRFHGFDPRNFLFKLHPAPAVKYKADERDKSHLWSDHSQIAVGGRENYFGLSFDSHLSQGTSHVSSTFHSKCLASAEEFTVDEIEVWGFVRESQLDDYKAELLQREEQAVSRDKRQKEGSYVLDLLGRGHASQRG